MSAPNNVQIYSSAGPFTPSTMPRVQKTGKTRNDPLLVQLDEDSSYAKYGRVSQPGKRKKARKQDDEDLDDNVKMALCSESWIHIEAVHRSF